MTENSNSYGNSNARFIVPNQQSSNSQDNRILRNMSKSELMMRKTQPHEGANAAAKLFQDQRKQSQLLISINCSKATPTRSGDSNGKAGMVDLQQRVNPSQQAYGLESSSKLGNTASTLHQRSPEGSSFHVDCKNGQSMLSSNKYQTNGVNIHRKNLTYFQNPVSQNSQYSALLHHVDRNGHKSSSTTRMDPHRMAMTTNNNFSHKDSQSVIPATNHQRSARVIEVQVKSETQGTNDYSNDTYQMAAGSQRRRSIIKGQSSIMDTSKHGFEEDDISSETGEVDMNDLFPLPESKQKKSMMHDRALHQLKTILQNKGIKDSSLVISNNNFGLYHFHIDTADNHIQLNKFETKSPKAVRVSVMSMDNRHHLKVNHQISKLSTLKSVGSSEARQSLVSSGPHILHREAYDSNDFVHSKIEKLAIQTTEEDFVSESLVKESPHLKERRLSKNDHFMMQVRSTLPGADVISKSSSLTNILTAQQGPGQRTILFTKEVDDLTPDYSLLEIKQFVKLSDEELGLAYNRLQKLIVPVFSGAVDTLINKIDLNRAVDDNERLPGISTRKNYGKMFKRKSELNKVEANLVEELKTCKESLDAKKMMYGMWSVMNQQGSIPHSREGGKACMVNNNYYLFGGFSRDLFGDFRIYDQISGTWKIIQNDQNTPTARYSHTMMVYDRKIIVFGGAGPYMQAIKMRICFNDIHIYDTDAEKWLKEPEIEGAPRKRMGHSSCVLGGYLLVHGGFNTEQKQLLNEFGLFDIEIQKWIKLKIYLVSEQNEKSVQRIDDQHFHYDHLNSHVIGYRQMHSMNAIFDEEYYMDCYGGQRIKQKRSMWIRQRRFTNAEVANGLSFREGYYMFGGVDQRGLVHNDLWLIEPHYEDNEITLNRVTNEYFSSNKQLLSIKTRKITNFSGRPPCPRIMHGTTVFRDWNKHYHLVVYGGRNDTIYQRTQNVALNDICLFNLHRLEWVALAMYGQMPCSRWSHCFSLNHGTGTSSSSGGIDGFLIFGGVNLKNYCKSRIFQFQFLNNWYVQKSIFPKVEDEEVDEKIQMLISNVKQKSELIKEILEKRKE